MTVSDLPTVNAGLNGVSAVLLTLGYVGIKKRRASVHKKFMLAALAASAMFLTSYLIYHARVGSVPYPYHDWTRPVYFAVLVPHIVLAAAIVPFIVAAVIYALRGNFDRHTRITRLLWPAWMFVSLSGIAVYFMLYH